MNMNASLVVEQDGEMHGLVNLFEDSAVITIMRVKKFLNFAKHEILQYAM